METDNVCRLCLKDDRALTFEHIPPRSALNKHRVQLLEPRLDEREGLAATPGRYQQRGAGAYLLCAECNSLLGRLYVPAYSAFVSMIALTLEERYDELAAMRSLRDLNARPTYRFEVKRREKGVPGGELYPMRIARQALSMVLVVSPPGYPKERSQLVKLVLNPAENAVPIGVRLGFCFYVGQLARTYGYAGAADLETGELRVMTEVSHPPLSWIMAVGGTSLPSGLIDVTHWLGLDYDDTLIDVGFEAQLGFGESLLPADYRTLGQRETQAQLSDRGRAR